MSLRFVLIAIASLAFASDAIAQLEENDTARWQFNSNFSLRLNKGNVERLIITPEANVSHISPKKDWGFSARQRYTYGTFGPIKTENDLLSRNFIYLTPQKRVYPYLMAWFQTHARQKLEFRYQVGPGVTFVPLHMNHQVLKVSVTGTYERNTYRQAGLTYFEDKTIDNYSVVRATLRVFGSHTLSEGIVSLYYEFLFQQALDNADNWRIFTEGGINTRVTHGFSIRTFINYELQNVHVETEKGEDLVLSVGVNWRVSSK